MGINTRLDATAPQTRKYQSDRAFLGHPRGLGYLAFSEGWERFSYYGMTALLALYSAQYLFKPGHIENIWGFTAFRQSLEVLFGPLTPLGMGERSQHSMVGWSISRLCSVASSPIASSAVRLR